MFQRISAVIGAIAALAWGAPTHANLVTNGGFETETLDGNGTAVPPPGWAINGDGVLIDTVFPNTGTYDVAFTALSTDPNAGMLSQTIATTPGQAYALQFAVLDEAGFSGDSFVVTFGGFSATITGDMAAAPGNLPSLYTSESFDVPGADITGTNTLLSFEGLNDPASGIDWNLDDASVTAATIPEPSGLWLFGTALAVWPSLVMTAARRRRPVTQDAVPGQA